MGDDQPQKDPGPIPPEPTIKAPWPPRDGDQPIKDPGPISTELHTRGRDDLAPRHPPAEGEGD